jgi:hypothetical protein
LEKPARLSSADASIISSFSFAFACFAAFSLGLPSSLLFPLLWWPPTEPLLAERDIAAADVVCESCCTGVGCAACCCSDGVGAREGGCGGVESECCACACGWDPPGPATGAPPWGCGPARCGCGCCCGGGGGRGAPGL